ncbi:hypothetical protein [Caenispirillum bisanense]|uniref:hypothetical protein n=1 Tax=Caenispirillum bisanense TaxID=414052 RepID=UPI0031DF4C59
MIRKSSVPRRESAVSESPKASGQAQRARMVGVRVLSNAEVTQSNAVEGIVQTPAARARAEAFDRAGLSAEERCREIARV